MKIDSHSNLDFSKLQKKNVEENTANPSQAEAASSPLNDSVKLSSPQLLDKAAQTLSSLEEADPAAVSRAQEVIANWQSPSNEQIDKIFESMSQELSP